MEIDLNCDLGEGMTTDEQVMPFITSANVACCFHAGDPSVATRTLELCQKYHVRIGAHPGYADREHFGRRELKKSFSEIFAECQFQIGGLFALAKFTSTTISYLKPHGALYNQASREREIAIGILLAAFAFDLHVLGLPDSELQKAIESFQGLGNSIRYVPEGFADRRYRSDGSLVPRTQPDAMITDPIEAVEQVEWLIGVQKVRSICVHGDHPQALEFVRTLRESLIQKGHHLRPFT